MATKKPEAKKKVAVKKPVPDKINPKFIEALKNIDVMGRELINAANDPFKMGCKIAAELRIVASRIENEAMEECISLTEASYSSETVIGVGIGVI